MTIGSLCLYARNPITRQSYEDAANRLGLRVVSLAADPASFRCNRDDAVRAPGGLVASAMRLGAQVQLRGPTGQWFGALDAQVTGREWNLLDSDQVRALLRTTPAFVKLADAKTRNFPARLFRSTGDFDAALAAVEGSRELRLLATTTWLPIESEYRVFTVGRSATTVSPYLIEDEPWTPLLHTHKAFFHHEAADFVATVLGDLPDEEVPPAAALDVARLRDGRMIVLEANQAWAAALYGCDPDAALQSVLAANEPVPEGQHDRWRWHPEPGLAT